MYVDIMPSPSTFMYNCQFLAWFTVKVVACHTHIYIYVCRLCGTNVFKFLLLIHEKKFILCCVRYSNGTYHMWIF